MNLSKPKEYYLPLDALAGLGFSHIQPQQCFSFLEVPAILFIDAPGKHLASFNPFSYHLNHLSSQLAAIDPALSLKDAYRCLALGKTHLASCYVNKKADQAGSSQDPPPIEILDLLTQNCSRIHRYNVRDETIQESLGFYEALALSLSKKDDKLAVLERFQWMPWASPDVKKPIPPRLKIYQKRQVETGSEMWEEIGRKAVPWQAVRFLSSFENTIVLTGRHDVYFFSPMPVQHVLQETKAALNLDTLHPSFLRMNLKIEALSADTHWLVFSEQPEMGEKATQYFYTHTHERKVHRLLPKEYEPMSNILFVKEDTLAYLAKQPGKIYYDLVFFSVRTNAWESWPIYSIGYSPPAEYKDIWPVKGKLVLLGSEQLALLWCRAPITCWHFFSIPLSWTKLSAQPGDLGLYIWAL